jgi:hypothetical protein
MARGNAPARLTGGEGFNYEDHVAARFLLGLLGAAHPLGPDLGRLTRVDWQAADAGWRVDDLALTFGAGGEDRAVGVSIKSHKQVTESGFDPTFTRACWEQWLGVGTARRFRVDRDQIALVAGVLADGVRTAWDALLGSALELVAAPDRLVARLEPATTKGVGSLASEKQRALFDSFRCPDALRAAGAVDDTATVVLVRHVRLLHLDFESNPSRALAEAVGCCQAALRGGTPEAARSLWDALVRIAARKRDRGGSLDLPELLARLRGQFELADHPDYRPDWAELDRRSRERYELVGFTVGGTARLARRRVRRALFRHLRDDRTAVVVGASGVGKSAVVRRLGEGRRYRLVWLTADLLQSGRRTAFEAALGLRHEFVEVVAASPARCLVVFDGLDGLDEPALRLVARLVGSLRQGPRANVRVALTAQPDWADRLRSAFLAAGVPTDTWAILALGPPTGTAVGRLLTRCTGLATAALRPEFRSLLRNLKVFDWAARLQAGGGLSDGPAVATLSTLIDRLWTHLVEVGPDGLARAALLKRVAAAEADRLTQGVPLSELAPTDLPLLPSLQVAGLLARQDERVRFVHDAVADWARLRVLVEAGLPESDAGLTRAAGAGWYRAARLFGQRLLEQPGDGVGRWRRTVEALATGELYRVVVRDLLLEALLLAADAGRLLTAAWPALVAGEGELLRLLLDRFAFVGTFPNHSALSAVRDRTLAAELEHLVRVPFEPYWVGVLPVLAAHADDVIRYATAPAAKLLRLWLSSVPPSRRATRPLRLAAAGLALALAREVQAGGAASHGSADKEVRTDAYVALLWAAPEYPGEVAQVCLELATRRAESKAVVARREAARLAADRRLEADPRAAAFRQRWLATERMFEPDRGPWPDGPRSQADEAFQVACLDRQAILPLAVNRPAEAAEVLLAALIEPPTNSFYGGDFLRARLGLDDCRACDPPFYHQGPFWTLLRSGDELADFSLALVIRVVNFAAERWREHRERLDAEYGGDPEGGPVSVRVPGEPGWVEHPGDRSALHWHDGWPARPSALSSMLMAVERWLYDEADAGRPIDRWVGRILGEGRSAALVGVLVDLGKYRPELLAGSLRPIVGAAEVYAMEPRLLVERAGVAFWSVPWSRHGEDAWNRARDWHTMPHRKTALADHVMRSALGGEAVRRAVMEFYAGWEARVAADPGDRAARTAVNQFAVVVRHARATAEGGDALAAFNVWLAERRAEAEASERRASEELLALTLAPQCRKRLDETSPLPPDQLDQFLHSLRRLADRPEPTGGGTRPADAVLGGVAVLLALHRGWVREDPPREAWCRERLTDFLSGPPDRRPFDPMDSAGTCEADTFAAECGVVLLAEDPSDSLARWLVLSGLISSRLATVAATVGRAYRVRTALGPEFDRITRFAEDWAARRWATRWAREWGLDTDRLWARECRPRLEAFERGGAVPARRPVADIDAEGRTRVAELFATHLTQVGRRGESRWRRLFRRTGLGWLVGLSRRLRPAEPGPQPDSVEGDEDTAEDYDYPTRRGGIPSAWPGLDPMYLRAAFAWLDIAVTVEPLPEEVPSTLAGLLALTLRTTPTAADARRPNTRFPTDFDGWLFERIAAALLRMDERESASLWRPILSLGWAGGNWVQHFLSVWFRSADRAARPDEFVALWRRIIWAALDFPAWQAGPGHWHDAGQLVAELLGLGMGVAVFGEEPQFAALVGSLRPEYERAAGRWFGMASVARAFCRFALKPCGAELLRPGIQWLAEAERQWSDWDWDHNRLPDTLAVLLRVALERHGDAFATPGLAGDAYMALSNRLVARGHHAALSLRERLASSERDAGTGPDVE